MTFPAPFDRYEGEVLPEWIDANGHMNELVGFYRKARGSKYFKGPQRPRLADLSDTELAIYGP